MSYPTEPAFVAHAKGYDANLLQHPLPRFLHAHELVFDAKDLAACKPFYHPSMTYTKSNGQSFSGPAAVDALHGDYALFTSYFHEPVYGVISETPGGGHRLFGHAKLFVNLPGAGADGDKKHEDLQGNKWDCLTHGAFLIEVVRDEDGPLGFRIKEFQTFADPTVILGEAIKRGIIPVEALTS